ncbi:SCO family protein [Lichenibacterium dinghuense]|uniref:SCO family protein n=1 Tax=Lichenibacterium dinghuense TaxID=2895977 RepID=UPI001F1935D1|nr:SCO family protein [Lichenibacterium sp. 6Y81]
MKLRPTLLVALLLAAPAAARADDLSDFAFEQRPGAAVPAAPAFTEADGRRIAFGDLLGHRPVVLALGYFSCPTLCSVVRDDLLEALSHTGLRAGADYDLASVSIDPAETPADAAKAEADDAARYPGAAGAPVVAGGGTTPLPPGWHFLTGDGASVAAVAAAVGFRSRYDAHLKQFLHPAGIVVLTPEGRVSGYVLGVGYHAGDLRTAVTVASTGGIARAALPLLLLCFHFDAETGRYSLSVMKVLRAAGVVTVLAIAGTMLLAFRRERVKT